MSLAYSLMEFTEDVRLELHDSKSEAITFSARLWDALVSDLQSQRALDGKWRVGAADRTLVLAITGRSGQRVFDLYVTRGVE